MADSTEPIQNAVGPTLVAMATKFGQIWAILHKITYKSACMPDRPGMFAPTSGADQGGGRSLLPWQ